jgi:type I restriction enzyme S subunit
MAQPKLNQKFLNGILVPWMSSLDLMAHIVSKLQKTKEQSNQLKVIGQKKLKHLDQLKQSILQKAFSGELTATPDSLDRSLAEAGL